MRRLAVLAVLVVASVAACVPSLSDETEKVAEDLPKVPVIVVLDASGSMKVKDAPGQRFAAARKAVGALVDALSDDHEIGLTAYGTATGSSDAEKAKGCKDVTAVVPFGPLDKKAFSAAVDRLKPSGYTPIGAALEQAAGQLPSSGERAIVLVSDGIDTCSPPDPCAVAEQLHDDDPDLVVHTLAFRVADDPKAREQLSCIAEATGGLDLDASSGLLLTTRLLAAFDPARAANSLQPSGYRGLEPGMSVADARKVAPKLGDVKDKGRLEIVYVDCTLVFDDGVLVEIVPRGNKIRTLDGVGVGTDVARAERLYGRTDVPTVRSGDTVTYPADEQLGTGLRVTFDPSGSGIAGTITRIVLCRCAPAGGRLAVEAPFDRTRGVDPDAYVWTGGAAVPVRAGSDEPLDSMEPVGFAGDRAVFIGRAGAHGHAWRVFSADARTGGDVRHAACDACDSVVVAGDEVVGVDAYELRLRRWSPELADEQVVDLPADDIDQPAAEFGDPYPYARVVAADGDAAYIVTRRSGDPVDGDDDGSDDSTRVLKVTSDGQATWSPRLESVSWSHAAVLSGRSLVVTGFDQGVLTLDASTLEIASQIDLPAPQANATEVGRTAEGRLWMSGVPCSACDGPPSTWTHDAGGWAEVDVPEGAFVACSAGPASGLRGLGDVEAVGGYDSRPVLRVQRGYDGAWRDVGRVDGSTCVVG